MRNNGQRWEPFNNNCTSWGEHATTSHELLVRLGAGWISINEGQVRGCVEQCGNKCRRPWEYAGSLRFGARPLARERGPARGRGGRAGRGCMPALPCARARPGPSKAGGGGCQERVVV